MGITYLDIMVKRLPSDAVGETLEFLVDTGATYTLAPGDVLARLGIQPHRSLTVTLADGSKTSRPMGGAYFEYQGVGGVAPVLFGQGGDANLLGATALEAMGMMIDPLSRSLRPLPAMLARLSIP
ncbi:MAG: aspartyl protease family protein [Phycisphaerales bacterium]|nr:aspartyl protease family protein [Phycisphaerales bacterium]